MMLVNAGAAVAWAAILHVTVLRHVWPWDWRGRRKTVTLTRGRRPWE